MPETYEATAEVNAGLGGEFTANKAERSRDLSGSELRLLVDSAPDVQLRFHDDSRLSWARRGDETIEGDYEALRVTDGLYLVAVDYSAADQPGSLTVIADLHSRRAIRIFSDLGPVQPNVPTVRHQLDHAVLDGDGQVGDPITTTAELSGRRAMWIYSDNDIYEHIYLNSDWYVWHCLKGEEYPLADTDPCSVYKLRRDIYLLVFSEKVLTLGAAMILDFAALRSYCAAFGTESDGRPTHFVFGAHGRVLSQTTYPDPLTG